MKDNFDKLFNVVLVLTAFNVVIGVIVASLYYKIIAADLIVV